MNHLFFLYSILLFTSPILTSNQTISPSRTLDSFYQSLSTAVTSVVNYVSSYLGNTNANTNETAYVRISATDELCQGEQQCLTQRKQLAGTCLQQFLNTSIDQNKVPTIALCFSGGGFRAMLLSLGVLQAAQETGIFDSISYIAGLSGSTWAIASWIASGNSIASFNANLSTQLANGLQPISNNNDLTMIVDIIGQKLTYQQPFSTIDIYGAILANTLLTNTSENRFTIPLTTSHANVLNGQLPIPLYTTITPNTEPYEWFEFSPFEVGSTYLHAYIPTWASGRTFNNGVSTNEAPELPFGYLMGTFGSAFEVDIKDVMRMTASNITQFESNLPSIIQPLFNTGINDITNSSFDDARLLPATITNFSYQINASPLQQDSILNLMDAGIDFNIAVPPLLRSARAVDIIIIYDSSADIIGTPELYQAQTYAQSKGLKFPPITGTNIDKELVTVFRDANDPTCPVVIYFPRIKNPAYSTIFDPETCTNSGGYCDTYNFNYSQAQVNQLQGLAAFTFKQQINVIKQVIQEVIAAKA